MFRIDKIPDHTLFGLGCNQHKITKHGGETYAHLAVNNGSVIVRINKVMSMYELKMLTEFISDNSKRLQSVVTNA